MTWALLQISVAALLVLLFPFLLPGDRKMPMFFYVILVLVLILTLSAALFIHRFRVPKPPKQDARDLIRLNNLFLCVDCAGHIAAHHPWCGLPRPDGFVDIREVRDPVVDPDAIRKPRARRRVRVAAA